MRRNGAPLASGEKAIELRKGFATYHVRACIGDAGEGRLFIAWSGYTVINPLAWWDAVALGKQLFALLEETGALHTWYDIEENLSDE